MADGDVRLLVRVARGASAGRLSLDGGKPASVTLQPLMPSIEAATGGRRLSATAAATPVWQIASVAARNVNPWDACHAVVSRGLGMRGGEIRFAEPDLRQSWLWTTRDRLAFGMTSDCATGAPQKNKDYPVFAGDNYWHLKPNFSQLSKAHDAAGGSMVRIAHLDTGYDPNHAAKPARLRTDLQKNFADADRTDDATDRPTAEINPMFGHGTGTLGLLGGKIGTQMLGGACDMEIVPIRVANWVVLFENSAIAKALDYVHQLCRNPATRIDVVTMSMGGLASAAWADAVNALYEAGVFVVAASGNNFGNLPTRYIVYPARFNRVVAACGAMADGRPYADLPIGSMAGSYGPNRKMKTALSAYTPNVPWAKFGCPQIVDFDGGGTSAATPQIAASAALWIQKNRAALDKIPPDKAWMRVEAVRKALFDSAKAGDERHFGHGLLRASDALGRPVAGAADLNKTDADSASFSLLRVLTGLGVTERAPATPEQRMLELEALQLSQQSRDIENLMAGAAPDDPELRASARARPILEALADHPHASNALKNRIARELRTGMRAPSSEPDTGSGDPPPKGRLPGPAGGQRPPPGGGDVAAQAMTRDASLPPPEPSSRRLRVFAFDPVLRTRLETLNINRTTLEVRWENELQPGPVGEYLEVVDIDPASNRAYPPVDLNHPMLLAQDGLAPTEGNPQFHQQTVYAVAMKTIHHFERALGRVALWADRQGVIDGQFGFRFVRRLRIYPHALPEANAYYSPEKHALLFGYFPASSDNPGDNLPGGLIFSCLSHDIVAHETTHALLDGLHPHFRDYTSNEGLAFHEAFADMVALFQHFTLADALRDQIRKSRGDLTTAQLLGGLALQFGQAIGNRGALRSAIASYDEEKKVWIPITPSRNDFDVTKEVHELGAVLVAAVFDAFLQIYDRKADELKRLATGGSGVLPAGQLPYDLVEHLADAAATIASRVLNICIRALDYCPPVDLKFGDYLRALVTADRDLVPDDEGAYRVAFISAFRARGIYPSSVRNLSDEGLCWDKPHDFELGGFRQVIDQLSLKWKLTSNRYEAFVSANNDARALYQQMLNQMDPAMAEANLGIVLVKSGGVIREIADGTASEKGTITRPALTVRPSRRVRPNGEVVTHAVIEITQRWTSSRDGTVLRGGCTIIVDSENQSVQYVIGKRLLSAHRLAAQRGAAATLEARSAFANYFDGRSATKEPFAMSHRHL